MRLLLDTCTFLWLVTDDARLSARARALFADPDIPTAWTGFDVIAEQLNFGEFPPQVPWLEEFRHSAASATQDVIAGRKTPEEAQVWLLDEVKRIKGG